MISMTKECGDCPIKSKFGAVSNPLPINYAADLSSNSAEIMNKKELHESWSTSTWQYYVLRDNIIIWDGDDVTEKNCTRHLVEVGSGNLTMTDSKNISRLMDPKNELDFMLSDLVPSEESCFDKNISTHVVLGKPGIHIKVITSGTSKRNVQSEINLTGHLQFMQNSVVDQENKLVQNIRNNYCENQRIKLNQAIGIAQYNGWLGAAILQLPYCTRLIPTAHSAFVQECESKMVRFKTERDKCGAKPTWNNYAISVNGKELTKNEECYWKGSVVTMGTQTYTLINDNWTVIQPSYAINIDRATERIAYRVDNAMDHIFSKDLESDDFVVSHMYAVTDLMAIVNAQDNDPEIGRPHVSSN